MDATHHHRAPAHDDPLLSHSMDFRVCSYQPASDGPRSAIGKQRALWTSTSASMRTSSSQCYECIRFRWDGNTTRIRARG